MTGWVCRWKTFWIPVDDSFKKSFVEDLVFQIADTSDSTRPGAPRVTLPVPSSQREAPKPEISVSAPEHIEAPLPLLWPRPTCERFEPPFSDDDILSGFEDHHLPRSDQFTMWGKMTSEEILGEHVVDIHRIAADFRDAFERIQTSSSQSYGVNKYFSSVSCAERERRLSVYNWNPGPRRGTEDAIEKQIAGKWHLITLQEASHYVEHEILHEHFHVPHFAGRAVLFNKDTFYPDISVKSIYLHDTRRVLHDHIVECEHGWVLQGAVSRAPFGVLQPVVKQSSLFYHFTSTLSTPRKEVLPRKSSRPFVLL